MPNTTDLYLGAFLVLCGFALSLLNLRRVVKGGSVFSSVLLSENVVLMCIGVAFVSRSVYALNPSNVDVYDMEKRTADLASRATAGDTSCGFATLLVGYGPLVVSMVNSFITLIIDNYMHYKMLGNIKEKTDENIVREIGQDDDSERNIKTDVCKFWKKYFSVMSIALQWILPVLMALGLFSMDVKEISVSRRAYTMDESCMAMLNLIHEECNLTNLTADISKYIQSPVNFFELHDNNETNQNQSKEIDTVLSNVLRIINNFNNHTDQTYAKIKSPRQPKIDETCMKMCYTDNKSLLLYMFVLAFVSYFIPITISTIILTRIHVMDVQKPNMKTYVTRELLYNILFWTPVMFDTFLSLILCSYSTHGVRTSMFNVIANIYQAVKNFMNTKYFKENVIVPV